MKKNLTSVLILVMMSWAVGCVNPVFTDPATVSTKGLVTQHVRSLEQTVQVESCTYQIVFFPIMKDPRKIHDELLEEAKAAGGNALIDVRYETTLVAVVPLFIKVCTEATGTVAVVE